MFEELIFIFPFYFYASIIFAGIVLFLFLYKSQKYNFLGFTYLQRVYGHSSYYYYIFSVLVVWSILGFWVLFSRPTQVLTSEVVQKNGIDIAIVFDVSFSMIAQDILPSRIETAKSVTQEFISQLTADRLGVIVFAGKPFSSVPLTFDYQFIRDFFSDLQVDVINQERPHLAGTAIGDGLMLGTNMLLTDEWEREKVIILLTDGEANRGLDPLVALSYVKEKNIKVYTIGVWKDENTFIEIHNNLWFTQKIQVWPVDEETLQKIANETWGKYYRADSKQTLQKIFSDIETLEKKEIETQEFHSYQPDDTLFIILLLLLQWGVWFFLFYKRIDI